MNVREVPRGSTVTPPALVGRNSDPLPAAQPAGEASSDSARRVAQHYPPVAQTPGPSRYWMGDRR
jgi:hypothetical protein